VSGSEAKVEIFHPGYQIGPFDVEGKSISLFFRVNEGNILAMCPLAFMRGYELLWKTMKNR
jgi:hypothetical protein